MQDLLKGKRTLIFNGIMLIAGITGAAVTPEMAEEAAGAVLAVVSIVNIILRAVTSTPILEKD